MTWWSDEDSQLMIRKNLDSLTNSLF